MLVVLVAFVALAVIQLVQRRGLDKLLYNGAVYVIGAASAGAAAAGVASLTGLESSDSVPALVLTVCAGATAFYVTNVALIGIVVARAAQESVVALVMRSLRRTAIPFAIMASITLILTELWPHSPLLSVALVGPLVAVALYQRSVHDALSAMRLALTDPLTGSATTGISTSGSRPISTGRPSAAHASRSASSTSTTSNA